MPASLFFLGLALGMLLAGVFGMVGWYLGYATAIERIARKLRRNYLPYDMPLSRLGLDDDIHGDHPTIDHNNRR